MNSAIASSVASNIATKSGSKLLSRIATVGAAGLAIAGAVLVGKHVVDCLKKTKQSKSESQTKSNPETTQSTSEQSVEIDLGAVTPKAIIIAEEQADEMLKDRDMAKAKRIAITHTGLISRGVENHNGIILERVLSDSRTFQENDADCVNALNIIRNAIVLDTRHNQDVEPDTITEVMDTLYCTTNLPQWAVVALVRAIARLASIDVENSIRGCATLWTPSIVRQEINGVAANVVDYKSAISLVDRTIEEIYNDLYREE